MAGVVFSGLRELPGNGDAPNRFPARVDLPRQARAQRGLNGDFGRQATTSEVINLQKIQSVPRSHEPDRRTASIRGICEIAVQSAFGFAVRCGVEVRLACDGAVRSRDSLKILFSSCTFDGSVSSANRASTAPR